VTLRALEVLGAADVIACEDTRVTAKLLSAHGITTPMVTYHEHNAAKMRPKLIERLKCGEAVALVSDAGTPLVSDPGYKLVEAVIGEGLPVSALPGPSAALAALLVSGLPSDRFFFAGFLPPKSAARRRALSALVQVPGSVIFFESAGRLAASLTDMTAAFGPRPAAVVRELTKRFEEVRRGDLESLERHYRSSPAPRGEIVVVVGPPEAGEAAGRAIALDDQLRSALKRLSLRDAAAAVATATGLPKREVYARALALAGADVEDGAEDGRP
jgi:16S rRNA (cytidine1402-2'-O)-methyltransferase